MVAELAALMASQRSFISYAAHELRSPLAALQGELQLALRRPRTEEGYVETLGTALTEVGLLTQLAEDLLTLARAQADTASVEHTRIEAIVEDAIRLVQGAAQIQDTTIDVDVEPVASETVMGRRRDLSRLLRNLLENAVKFGPHGSRVSLTGTKDGFYVVIAVEDKGPGIAPKDRAHVFEPFFRGSSKTNGTGLGLAIAREIARKSGGDITFDEAFTPGTRLQVKLLVAGHEPRASLNA
jgi:signal transduction histidine kinase